MRRGLLLWLIVGWVGWAVLPWYALEDGLFDPGWIEDEEELSQRSHATRPASTWLRIRPSEGPELSCTTRTPWFSAMKGSP